ncbi:MAG: rhodanese-like domain-containing protein, partial [Myxococcota bacterium]
GDDLVLVDTRPLEERKVSILPGAISLEAFEQNRSDYGNRQVITYCTVGVRSGIAANKLRKDGVDVLNFKGSILAWTHADGPLVTPDGTSTRQVHVYGPRWNFAALDYTAVLTKSDGTVYPAP